MTVSAAAIVAAARTFLSGWEYVSGAHGRLDPATGKYETDCQYLVDRVMQIVGLADRLGPELPWEVTYMVHHTTLPKVDPATAPLAGWIVVMGTPGATDDRVQYAHTGIVTGSNECVSALNPREGVKETRISDIRLHVMMYLDTGVGELHGGGGGGTPTPPPAPTPTPPPGTPPAPTPPPAPKPTPPPAAPGPSTFPPGGYTVVHGDTLSGIAARFGLSWPALYAANVAVIGPNPNMIKTGMVLHYPAVGTPVPPAPQPTPPPAPAPTPSGRTYTVVRGDTLSGIAYKTGVRTWQILVALNVGRYPSLAVNPGFIRPGWVLNLP